MGGWGVGVLCAAGVGTGLTGPGPGLATESLPGVGRGGLEGRPAALLAWVWGRSPEAGSLPGALPTGCSCQLGTISAVQRVYQEWKNLTTTIIPSPLYRPPHPAPAPAICSPAPTLLSTQSEIQHQFPVMPQLISYQHHV